MLDKVYDDLAHGLMTAALSLPSDELIMGGTIAAARKEADRIEPVSADMAAAFRRWADREAAKPPLVGIFPAVRP